MHVLNVPDYGYQAQAIESLDQVQSDNHVYSTEGIFRSKLGEEK